MLLLTAMSGELHARLWHTFLVAIMMTIATNPN